MQLVMFVANRRVAGSLPFEHWSNLALADFIPVFLSVPSCLRLRISTCLQLTSYQEPGVTGGVRQILKGELFNDSDTLLLIFPLIYLCVFVWAQVCHGMHVNVRGQLSGVPSFPHVDHSNGTQVVKLGGKYVYPLSC